jgi:hypothetical protein
MEVGQGPDWGCSAKGIKKMLYVDFDLLNDDITEILSRQVLSSVITQVKYRSPIIKMIYSVDILCCRKYEVF